MQGYLFIGSKQDWRNIPLQLDTESIVSSHDRALSGSGLDR